MNGVARRNPFCRGAATGTGDRTLLGGGDVHAVPVRRRRTVDEQAAALQERDAGRIVRKLLQAGDRAAELAARVGVERKLVRARGGQVRDLLAGRSEQLVDEDPGRLSFDRDAIQQAEDELRLRL